MRLRVHLQFVGDVEASLRERVHRSLEQAGVALAAPHERSVNAVVLFARGTTAETLPAVRAAANGPRPVLVVSAGGADGAGAGWPLLQTGAADVIAWNEGRPDVFGACVSARLARWSEVDALVNAPEVRDRLVGTTPAWRSAVRELVEAARAPSGSVLVTGESGTGKELAAHLIHALDPREDKRELVVLDCTTIVPTLAGSEFFGHERGAFTDAVAAREGAFAEADHGTLFLDELGDLPPKLQGELLRVIQEGMYKRVGSGVWRRTQFRLVCATNRDLRREVAEGRFRSDLYHRVAAWTVRLPPLRERRDDIPLLAEHLLREARPDLAPPLLDATISEVLRRREYPGNVRELRQLVGQIAARHVGPGPITVGALPPGERPSEDVDEPDWTRGELERCVRRALARHAKLREIGRAAEEIAIALALESAGGNLRRASLQLGITDRALQLRRAAARKNGDPRLPH